MGRGSEGAGGVLGPPGREGPTAVRLNLPSSLGGRVLLSRPPITCPIPPFLRLAVSRFLLQFLT